MMEEYYAVGLMSGTSVDGIDAGLFRFTIDGDTIEMTPVHARTYPFPGEVRTEILAQMAGCEDALPRLTMLNMVLGDLYADAVASLLDEAEFKPTDVAVIGSHGQTLYHVANMTDIAGTKARGSLQIGEASIIAQRCGIPTVSDFRTADIAAGGSGAPFVPILDRILSRNYPGSTAFQNIGGIGNVCCISNGHMVAFDTGPGNMIIDMLTEDFTAGEQQYDKDGIIGSSGKLDVSLLDAWMNHPYLAMVPPKTTGREDFGSSFMGQYPVPDSVSAPDAIHTAAVFTARTISEAYRKWLPELPRTVIVSGGGAHNPIIMQTLQADLPESQVMTGDQAGFSSDFKEAAAFALLGLLYLLDKPGNEPEATGAIRRVITGKLSKP